MTRRRSSLATLSLFLSPQWRGVTKVAALRAQMGRRKIPFSGSTRTKVEKLFDSILHDGEEDDDDDDDN